jgi:uncharacterized protein (DUF1778 family)
MEYKQIPTLQVYIDGEDREIVKEGARLSGMKVSAFFRSTAIKEARKILKENKSEDSA